MTTRFLAILSTLLLSAITGFPATITLDFNGFPCTTGGQVTGPGLEDPIQIPPNAKTIVLEQLQAEQTYYVDFFHDAGPTTAAGSGDFSFVVAADGQGVESVGLGGGVYQMVDGFKAGDRTLTLKTYTITFNANAGQTGSYYIPGLIDMTPVDSGPQRFTVIPGNYRVDNLFNTFEGLEDYEFAINDKGTPVPTILTRPDGAPGPVAILDSKEFAEFSATEINPRSVRVHFRVECGGPLQYHATHPATNIVADASAAEGDILLPVGGGGVNVWAFGTNTVSGGTVVNPNGLPDIGTQRENDYLFQPLLRYDLSKQQFYFVTTEGPSQTVTGEADGLADDGVTPIKAKVSMTIAAPEMEKTEPAAGE